MRTGADAGAARRGPEAETLQLCACGQHADACVFRVSRSEDAFDMRKRLVPKLGGKGGSEAATGQPAVRQLESRVAAASLD